MGGPSDPLGAKIPKVSLVSKLVFFNRIIAVLPQREPRVCTVRTSRAPLWAEVMEKSGSKKHNQGRSHSDKLKICRKINFYLKKKSLAIYAGQKNLFKKESKQQNAQVH